MTQSETGVRTLAWEFWKWRAGEQPSSYDDIPRTPRPDGWRPQWDVIALQRYREVVAEFETRTSSIQCGVKGSPDLIDLALLRSAVARASWELNYSRNWEWDPNFYIDQTVGAAYELLVGHGDWDEGRVRGLVRVLDSFPELVEAAAVNLVDRADPDSLRVALGTLEHAPDQVQKAVAGLPLPAGWKLPALVRSAAERAAAVLDQLRSWLAEAERTGRVQRHRLDARALSYFLYRVALLPYTPGEILTLAERALNGATVWEALAVHLARGRAVMHLPADMETQIRSEEVDEAEVRRFYQEHSLLAQPAALRHYRYVRRPDYLTPISWAGVPNDIGVDPGYEADTFRYVPEPTAALPYFARAFASDPRVAVVHEGVHAQQLALAKASGDWLRGHYYDSCPNEGIAFYNEEMMLRAGLFSGSPASEQILLNFMRLRALRARADLHLALGRASVPEVAAGLEIEVPMDRWTATSEAALFNAHFGQGMSYELGKAQMLGLVADAQRLPAPRSNLETIHNYVWANGNVPFAIQRLEYLASGEDLERVGKLAAESGVLEGP